MSELQEGDRVRHPTLGEGRIPTTGMAPVTIDGITYGEIIDHIRGTVLVQFDSHPKWESVALDRLSKVESEPKESHKPGNWIVRTNVRTADDHAPGMKATLLEQTQAGDSVDMWLVLREDGQQEEWATNAFSKAAASPLEHVEDSEDEHFKAVAEEVVRLDQHIHAIRKFAADYRPANPMAAEFRIQLLRFIDNGLEPLRKERPLSAPKEPEGEDPECIHCGEDRGNHQAIGVDHDFESFDDATADFPDSQPHETLREELKAATKPIPVVGGLILGRLHFDEAERVLREHFDSKSGEIGLRLLAYKEAAWGSGDSFKTCRDDLRAILFGDTE